MGYNNSYMKEGELIDRVINTSFDEFGDKMNSFEKGVRKMLLEMEEEEFKTFIKVIRWDRKRIRRSKKFWETKKK